MSEQYLTIEHLSTIEIASIFSRISIDPETDCWRWLGSTAGQYTYPTIKIRDKRHYVHRLVYAWLIEPVPLNWRAFQVDHECNQTLCCNPAHLQLKTAKENNRRSNSSTGQNARKTHCKNGHLLEGDNLCAAPFRKKGYRICRVCKNNYQTTPEAQARKRAYRAANLEKVRAQALALHYKHKEKCNAAARAYYYKQKALRQLGKLSE